MADRSQDGHDRSCASNGYNHEFHSTRYTIEVRRPPDAQTPATNDRQRIATVLLSTIAVASAVVVVVAGLLHPRFDAAGSVGAYEERISEAAVALPPHGVIGYVSDDQRDNRFETPS